MSSVRMSALVLSPAMLGLLPNVPPSKASIKRNLFGSSDGVKEHSRSFADEEIQKHVIQSSYRWEFDFENDKPMSGKRFVWAKVDKTCRPRITSAIASSRIVRELIPPSAASRIEVPKVQPRKSPSTTKVSEAKRSAVVQKNMTDFMKSRKRRADDADAPPAAKMARVNPSAVATPSTAATSSS